jgi:hypothetical protein
MYKQVVSRIIRESSINAAPLPNINICFKQDNSPSVEMAANWQGVIT